jgi:hypothetical protein
MALAHAICAAARGVTEAELRVEEARRKAMLKEVPRG